MPTTLGHLSRVRAGETSTDFERIFGEKTPKGAKWETYCLAFSALGHDLTGLPIDFKVQPATWANEKFPHDAEHPDNPRSAMIEG
jgi:hypothetical protein